MDFIPFKNCEYIHEMNFSKDLQESEIPVKISCRRAKRQVRKQKEKEIIGLHKKRKKLYKESRELPWIPVQKPYQSGWKRTFVCREDVLKSSDAEFFENILSRINHVQYSPHKDFRERRRFRKRGRKQLPDLSLNSILEEKFYDSEKGFGKREAKYFYLKEKERYFSKYKVYVFEQPWRFVEKVFPHIVTHQIMLNADLDSEIDFVKYLLISEKYHDLSIRHSGEKYWSRCRTGREPLNIIKNKPLHRICLEATEF